MPYTKMTILHTLSWHCQSSLHFCEVEAEFIMRMTSLLMCTSQEQSILAMAMAMMRMVKMPERTLLISCQGPEGWVQVVGKERDHQLPRAGYQVKNLL